MTPTVSVVEQSDFHALFHPCDSHCVFGSRFVWGGGNVFCVFLLSAALGGRLLDVFDVWQQHPIRADRIVRFVFGDGKRGLG